MVPFRQMQKAEDFEMNAVGIAVSKGKSTIAVKRPFVEVVASPYDVGTPRVNSKN